jgi:hypothetical protein
MQRSDSHSMRAVLFMLVILVGLILGLIAWWCLRAWHRGDAMEMSDGIIVGLSMLASFALGVFVTYVFLGFAR